MRQQTAIASATLLLAGLAGCSGDGTPTASPHNVEYYKTHPQERASVAKACARDQNDRNPVDCDNAAAAQRAINMAKDLSQ